MTAAPSGVVAVAAVAEGTRADTAVVAMSDLGATVMAVVIAGGRHMPGRAMRGRAVEATVKANRVNTTVVVATPSRMAIAPMATARGCRLNTLITPAIAVMVARGADRTLNVTIMAAVVKGGPGSPRADSRLVVVADSAIALVADAPADDAKRSGGGQRREDTPEGDMVRITPCHPFAFSV